MNNPDIDWVPERWEESVNSVLDNAYTYGRSAISDGVRFILFISPFYTSKRQVCLSNLLDSDSKSRERSRTGESGTDGEESLGALGSSLSGVDDVKYRSRSRGSYCKCYVCVYRLGELQRKLRKNALT